MHVVLISTYELGHQPFGLASPAAWLEASGHRVTSLDLAVEQPPHSIIESADVIAFYIPMHTATRIAVERFESIRAINRDAHYCFYGLYAVANEDYLRRLGAATIVGGEFEEGLVELCNGLASAAASKTDRGQFVPLVSLRRQAFVVPSRHGLPPLSSYAHLTLADGTKRTVGYTEASRGCRHICRHCPVVPVYNGQFRVVQPDVVLGDIRQQIDAGAEHITFGDPDFFNGPGHALKVARQLHDEWPNVTYDVTIKVEHLLKRSSDITVLRETGCILVTSAIESVDDDILSILDKGHTRADVFRVVNLLREADLALNPTFVTFTPWTSIKSYVDFLQVIAELDLIDSIAPIQYAIRLLVPEGSRLLELPVMRQLLQSFDARALYYPWIHPDPAVDALHGRILDVVKRTGTVQDRRDVFRTVCGLAAETLGLPPSHALVLPRSDRPVRAPIPCLSEPWFCCAEPTEGQLARV